MRREKEEKIKLKIEIGEQEKADNVEHRIVGASTIRSGVQETKGKLKRQTQKKEKENDGKTNRNVTRKQA